MNELALAARPNMPAVAAREHNVRPAYRADIDGLRAVAVLAVVLFHAFPNALAGGFVGVDIFFVISGFLISSIVFTSLEQGEFSLAEFYAHRIRRIFPALLVVLAACFAFGWVELLPDEYGQLGKHMAAGIGFTVNFVLWGEAGYFDTASEFKPLMHLWSLAIEEQFYLLYPLLIGLVWGRRRWVGLVLGTLTLVSFGLNVRAVGADAAGSFFLPQHRFWELLAGGLLACFLKSRPSGVRGGSAVPDVLSVAGLTVLLASALFFDRSLRFPGWWALLPVAGAVLLIAAGPRGGVNRLLLAQPAMRFVGIISYPLYLWHWPLLAFVRIAEGGEPAAGLRLAAVLLSIVLAYLTYRFVERPLRFGRQNGVTVAVLCVVALGVGLIGYKTFDREGFRFRQKNFGGAEEARKWEQEAKSSAACRQAMGTLAPEYCLRSGEGEPKVALIGDSHANALYPGLSTALQIRGEGLLHLGAPGCAPLLDMEDSSGGEGRKDRDCLTVANHLIETAARHATAGIVVLALRGPRNMHGTGFGPVETSLKPKESRWRGARESATQEEMFAGALEATVQRLLAAGKRVVIVSDWPELGFDPRACLKLRPIQFSPTRPGHCGVSLAAARERNREYRALLAALQARHRGLTVFDPWPLLCDAESCQVLRDGAPLYRDNNHLSFLGSAMVGSALAAVLPEAGGTER
jgi:peptidoglycan/LPS O-acetylase OafA/YrhL